MGGRGSGSRIESGGYGRIPDTSKFLQFQTQAGAHQWFLAHGFDLDRWENLLTEAERQGIRDYTGIWYAKMNTDLREGIPSSEDVKQRIEGATSGLAKWALQDQVLTFRGANYHWTANLLGGTEDQLTDPEFLRSRIGKQVIDKGFMSSGSHKDSAWEADVKYTILNRRGVEGMYVESITKNHGEFEFLYNRDSVFIVRGIKTDSYGHIRELFLEAKPKKKKAP